jgi:protein-tyrosine kinase
MRRTRRIRPNDVSVFDPPDQQRESNGAPTAKQHPVVGMPEKSLLSPGALERKRLIHPSMRSRRQMDLVRELRTNVLTKSQSRNPVLMVTGVSSRCGTSYLARNLAASIALDEERTALLMECNQGSPTLAEDFNIDEDSPGLLDLFSGGIQDLSSVIYPSGVARLRLIPVGGRAQPRRELYASTRMRALIHEIRGRYEDRYVVIDAPPVLGSPDARILAEHADLIILVVGEGLHRPEMIRRAANALPADRFAGIAFNHLP